ncbi:hypothetical protein [Nostoc sp.]|uniref:hypothetical protein n=1 Tax=Nostoc sp. TaxID=1180 RepID=UPI002FFAB896
MPKIKECVGVARLRHRCLLYAHNPYLVCAVHLDGVDGGSCLDFRLDPNAQVEEVWQPEGATYYNGELIVQPQQRWTPEEQLELLDFQVDAGIVTFPLRGSPRKLSPQ